MRPSKQQEERPMKIWFEALLILAVIGSTASAQQMGGYQVASDGRYLLAPDGRPVLFIGMKSSML